MSVEPEVPKRFFATYFDENYLSRALALIASLQRHCPGFALFALCMDDASYQRICEMRIAGVKPIALTELESANTDLLAVKSTRSRVEYYWTCGPAFMLFVLRQLPSHELLTYLDADLFFFRSLEPLYEEVKNSSIGIIAHRFSRRHKDRRKFGIYNVGWLAFRHDHRGLECLKWWRDRCIEWCFDFVDGSRFGDQKYLDDWPARFPGVKVLQHKGANVAVWNVDGHDLTERNGEILVDEEPLIFFHFHGFKQLASGLYDSNLGRSGYSPEKHVRQKIFGAYINALKASALEGGLTPTLRRKNRKVNPIMGRLQSLFRIALALFSRAYLVEFRGRVL